jgi:ankyrin repeat protein
MPHAQKKQAFNAATPAQTLGLKLARELHKAKTLPADNGLDYIDVPKCLALIAAGADVTTGITDRTPLMTAAFFGSAELTAALLKAGAPVDTVNNGNTTALLMAVFNYHYDIAAFLIDAGADPFIKNIFGKSPLSICSGRHDNMRYLIKAAAHYHKGNITPGKLGISGAARGQYLNELFSRRVLSQNGETTIDLMIQEQEDFKTIKSLMDAKTDYSQQDSKEKTCLHVAIRHLWSGFARQIISFAPETVNVPDRWGWTPLLSALPAWRESDADGYEEKIKLVTTLLEAGADVTVCNANGQNAFDLIPDTEPEIAALIEKALESQQGNLAIQKEKFRQRVRKGGISSGDAVKPLPRIHIRKPKA